MNQHTKTIDTTIPFLLTAWFFQESHNRRIQNDRESETAHHTIEVRMKGALAKGTSPLQLTESCAGIDGVTCESKGDTVTVSFFSGESRKKPYESRRWLINGHKLEFIGLAD